MRRINCKSDFDLILRLTSCNGEEIGFPDYDWIATFYTWSPANSYTASCIGGVCTNCFNDNGQIHVVFDNHHLTAGSLRCGFTIELPDEIYPDGNRRIVTPLALGVELVRDKGDCGTEAEVEAILPYIKGADGKSLTYSDLTEQEKEDLASHIPVRFEYDKETNSLNIILPEYGNNHQSDTVSR